MSDLFFADTNLFLRYLTNDDPQQADAVEIVLQQAAAGEFSLITTPLVIAEIIWALSKVYTLPQQQIYESIVAIVGTDGIQVESESLIVQAMEMYIHKNIDFVDAYNICWMQANGITTAYTFDHRHFSRVAGIDVNVPGRPSI